MNKEQTEKLYQDFPNLYKQHKLPMTQTNMCWGFDVSDGWFKLIYDLSKAITELDDTIEASQVKEKFGTLRFYTSGGKRKSFDKVCDLISKAENLSSKTCEQCGAKGKLRGTGWVVTLCDKCNEERNKAKEE